MFLMIDNYDSFVYNLVSYFLEENIEMEIIRNDLVDLKYIEDLIEKGKLEGIIISPGPKSPKDCGLCNEIVKQFYKKVAIIWSMFRASNNRACLWCRSKKRKKSSSWKSP